MKKRHFIVIVLMMILVSSLAACGPAIVETPTEEPMEETQMEPTPSEEMTLTPSVSVEDQTISEETVTVAEVLSVGPGWLVVHANAEGSPSEVIGHASVSDGQNTNVTVEIDTEAATETLYAMLHVDVGVEGTYEFPGEDAPAQVDGEIVMETFNVEMEMGSEDAVTVLVVDSDFEPEEVSVSTGTTVIWEVSANLPHTVTADNGEFDSGNLADGDKFEFTFKEPGRYPYHCTIHGGPGGSGMSGVIVVEE